MRQRFYMDSGIWQKRISSAAFHVYGYLSWCANRDRHSYPSVPEIKRKCGLSESTVRRAIRELEKEGLVQKREQYIELKNGKRRRTSNLYILIVQDSDDTRSDLNSHPSQISEGVGPNIAGEINDKQLITNTYLSVSPEMDTGLTDLLDRLELNCYRDASFAEAVEMAIRDMYFAKSISVSAEIIPQKRVRERLNRLTIDCTDRIYEKIRERGINYRNAGGFLKSCLYNAPMDLAAESAAFKASAG